MATAKPSAARPTYTPFACPAPPLPIDQITEPLPSVRRQIEATKRKEADEAKQKQVTRAAEQKSKGGFFDKLTAAAEEYTAKAQIVGAAAYSTAEEKALQLSEDLAAKRFATAFPMLGDTDKVLGDFSCRVLTTSGPVPVLNGHLDVTDAHLCFHCDEKVNFSIALADIVSIQKAVTLETENNGIPYVLPLPSPEVIPNAITVYTKQQKCHVFELVKEFKDALNVLDHVWRNAVGKVPVPGVQYA